MWATSKLASCPSGGLASRGGGGEAASVRYIRGGSSSSSSPSELCSSSEEAVAITRARDISRCGARPLAATGDAIAREGDMGARSEGDMGEGDMGDRRPASGACRSAACALAARASCLPPFFFVVFSPPARRVLPFAGTLLALATAPGCRCVLGRCFLVMTAVLGVGISATASVAFSGETVSVNMPIGAADVIARSSSSSGFIARLVSGANLTTLQFRESHRATRAPVGVHTTHRQH